MDPHRLVDTVTLLALGAIGAGMAWVMVTRTSCTGDVAPRESVAMVTRAEAAGPAYEPEPTDVTQEMVPSAEEFEEIAERAARRAVAAERARVAEAPVVGLSWEKLCADEELSYVGRQQLNCPGSEP